MKWTVLLVTMTLAGTLACAEARGKSAPEGLTDKTDRDEASDAARPNADSSRGSEFASAIHNGNTTGIIEALRFGEVNKRRDACTKLKQLGDPRAADFLIEAALQDRDWYVRSLAIDALLSTGDKRTVDTILKVLETDPNATTRRNAARCLGQARDASAVPALVDIVQNLTNDPQGMREAAIVALGYIGDRRAVRPLVQLLSRQALRSEHWVRIVPRTLAYIGDQSAVAPLLEAAACDDGILRSRALIALDDLTESEVPALCERLILTSENSRIKEAATFVLSKITECPRGADVALTLVSRKPEVDVGEPVLISIEVHNNEGRDLCFRFKPVAVFPPRHPDAVSSPPPPIILGLSGRMKLLGPDGRRVFSDYIFESPMYGISWDTSECIIKKGQKRSFVLDLSEYYDFSMSGVYTFSAALGGLWDAPTWKTENAGRVDMLVRQSSNSVTINVRGKGTQQASGAKKGI